METYMNDNALITSSIPNTSFQKQKIYKKYAQGKLSQSDLISQIANIKPQKEKLSWKQKSAILLSALVVAIMVPPWMQRDDD